MLHTECEGTRTTLNDAVYQSVRCHNRAELHLRQYPCDKLKPHTITLLHMVI
jgi:hypothetical protein